MAYLEIKNFTKSFGKTEVLKGIDLEINKGEVISIIGSSGSGKTTLLRCMNFLEFPDTGEMTLDGELLLDSKVVAGLSEKELRDKRINFGLVFQSFNLFPQYSVFKNLTLAPTLHLKEVAKKMRKQGKSRQEIKEWVNEETKRIKESCEGLLKKVGLEEKRDAYPCELSGGQCQRVAIARALALSPKILCFDEPTSALDPELTGEVLKVIKSLKGNGRTMVIVTHEMSFARSVSDKVVFMADGIIEEAGKAKEVFDNPQSEKLKAFLANSKNK